MGILRLSGPTALTSVTAGNSNVDQTALELLSNGSLIATFQIGSGQPNTPALHSIILSSSGVAQSARQDIAGGAQGEYLSTTEIASNAAGDIFLAWDRGPEGGGPTAGDVEGRMLNSSGAPSGAVFSLPSNAANGEFEGDVIALANGNFLALWSDLGDTVFPDLDTNIMAQVFTPAGARVGGEYQINQTSTNVQFDAVAATLTNGTIAVVWQAGTLGQDGIVATSIGARLLNAAGTPTGVDLSIATIGAGFVISNGLGLFEIKEMANGGFAVAWSEDNSDTSPTNATFNLKLQTFDFAGTATGTATTIKQLTGVSTTEVFKSLELMTMPSGQVAVYWQESLTQPPVAHLAVHSNTGAQINAPINLETVANDDGDILSVEMLANGQLMALTQSFGLPGSFNYSTELFEISLPGAAINGTPVNDPNLQGTANDETISGLAGDDNIFGNAGADTLFGGDGNDQLEGGTYADAMDGGDGNDIYHVDNIGDIASETNPSVAIGGYDIVIATNANHTLGANIEQLVIQGTATIGTGNSTANYLYGGLSGLSLTLNGMDGDDVIYASLVGSNVLTGGAGVDTLLMYGGNNVANGGTGADIYYTYTASDLISETGGDGIDTVYSNHSIVANEDIEQVILFGDATSIASGSGDDNNIFYGNSTTGAVTLNGGGGADVLFGGSFTDVLIGGAGVDLLFGLGGSDNLQGGVDTDVYYLTSGTEVVVEFAGEGFDTAYSNAAGMTVLASEVEQLILYGAATGGTGNSGNNFLYGHIASGPVTLDGGAGIDYILANGAASGDVLTGGAGNDQIDLSIGNGDPATGGNDTIRYTVAGSGSDIIFGFDADATGGQDLIDVSGRGFTAASLGSAITSIDVVNGTVVTIGADTILLLNVASTNLTGADFIF